MPRRICAARTSGESGDGGSLDTSGRGCHTAIMSATQSFYAYFYFTMPRIAGRGRRRSRG